MTELKEVLIDILNNKEANIIPENIKRGITALGVEGMLDGIDTSDATATEEDIISPKSAYVDGEKISGILIPTYDVITEQLTDGTINHSCNTGAITRDGLAVILWDDNMLYTYVKNPETNQYEFKHEYTEYDLGITSNDVDYATRLIDISNYVEDNICYVACFRYKNACSVITFNALTGELLYTGEDNKYVAKRGWFGSGERTQPFAQYLEPIYTLKFAYNDPSILFISLNNGFSSLNTISTKVSATNWERGNGLNTYISNNIEFTSDDKYVILNSNLYTLSEDKLSTSSETLLGTNCCINNEMTLAVINGELYSIINNDTLEIGERLTDYEISRNSGVWISEKVYCSFNNDTLDLYNFSNLDAIEHATLTAKYLSMQRSGKNILVTQDSTEILSISGEISRLTRMIELYNPSTQESLIYSPITDKDYQKALNDVMRLLGGNYKDFSLLDNGVIAENYNISFEHYAGTSASVKESSPAIHVEASGDRSNGCEESVMITPTIDLSKIITIKITGEAHCTTGGYVTLKAYDEETGNMNEGTSLCDILTNDTISHFDKSGEIIVDMTQFEWDNSEKYLGFRYRANHANGTVDFTINNIIITMVE